jgi:hypothetical protein
MWRLAWNGPQTFEGRHRAHELKGDDQPDEISRLAGRRKMHPSQRSQPHD